HRTEPEAEPPRSTTAQLISSPSPTCVAGPPRSTSPPTGRFTASTSGGTPVSPQTLPPQQRTAPVSASSAHVWAVPAAIRPALPPKGTMPIVSFASSPTFSCVPSPAAEPIPQHCTLPLSKRAHECHCPSATSTAGPSSGTF